jgi:hypothetical protein
VYTIRALNDLAEMAASKDDTATHDWAANKAGALTGTTGFLPAGPKLDY